MYTLEETIVIVDVKCICPLSSSPVSPSTNSPIIVWPDNDVLLEVMYIKNKMGTGNK